MDAWLEDSNAGHLYMEIRKNVSIGSLNGYEMGLDRIGQDTARQGRTCTDLGTDSPFQGQIGLDRTGLYTCRYLA